MNSAVRYLIIAATLLAPLAASAQSNSQDVAAGAAGVAIFGGMFALFAFFAAVAFGFFIFWIMMMVDCYKREWPEKTTWLIILIVSLFVQLYWLAALLYYFMIKQKNVGTMGSGSMPKQ